MDVVGVPVQVRNGAVVLSSVKHDQIKEGAELEVSPDSKIVVHLDLSDWHPVEM